jgi:2-methylisocitrate lyase-like PEP mutase family enzyme
MIDPTARRAAFRKLHERGCFVLPNPWDAGSARYLAHLGFHALATTSSGFAFSRGLPDSDLAVPLDMALGHIAEIVAAVDIPVNADFTAGYARDPAGVAANVRRCVDTGVAGLSIEDATGDPGEPLFERTLAVERVAAARAAIDASKSGVLLTARAECFLTGHPDALGESIQRLQAYAAAGADVLFAPGMRRREEIEAVVQAVAPKPVNVLQSASGGLRVEDLAKMGVRRISVGSGLARAAWAGFARAARSLAEGSFEGFEGAMSVGELNALFLDPAAHGAPRTGPAVR